VNIKEVESIPFTFDHENRIIYINNNAYRGTNWLNARRGHWDFNEGMKLKILSYQHVENILFAWVEIIK
jgi:hypothetical protein